MHHPDLEKQLEELKAQRQAGIQDLRDLASEAVESTDKVNKTMMMFMVPAGQDGCECAGVYCSCEKSEKKRTSRIFKNGKRKLKRKLKADGTSNTNGTHP